MILNWWCLQHPYKDSSAKHRKVQQVIDKGWAPPECPTKEHRYTGYEGAREVLEVSTAPERGQGPTESLWHLHPFVYTWHKAWSSNDSLAASCNV